MKTKHLQRLLAFVLVLCMVVPMLPTLTLPVQAAATDPVIVIAGSDFQCSVEGDTGPLKSILTAIKAKGGYTTADGFLFAGDYTNRWVASATIANKNMLKTAVDAAYPELEDENMIFVQGNHDETSTVTDGTLAASGAHDANAYGVYVINEDDFNWHTDGTEDVAKATAAALQTYLNEKVIAGYSRPVFVVSHIPLHFTMRTREYGDGRYANYIFDVLNDAGSKGLNIIFLFGHHHSGSWLDSQGGSAVYFAKGDSVNIPQASQTEFAAKTLNFTYMNAGYVGYFSTPNSGVGTDLTMSVFEISGNEVKISRYSANGLHDLKSAGVANTGYTTHTEADYFQPLTNVYTSPQVLNQSEVSADLGITVTSDGVYGVTASIVDCDIPSGYSPYCVYDIQPQGYTQGNTAAVRIPLDQQFDFTRPVVVIDNQTGTVQSCKIENRAVSFVTDHFGTYTVAQTDVQPSVAVGTTMELKQVTSFSGLKQGVPYVISDSKKEWVLTNTPGTTRAAVGTYEGLMLNGTPELTTPHVWYINADGHIVYGSADSTEYLLIGDNTNRFTYSREMAAGEENNRAAFVSYYGDDLYVKNVGQTGYLNRFGGTDADTVATSYITSSGGSGGSYWHAHEIVTHEITFSAVPSLDTVTLEQTALIVPTVFADGMLTEAVTLTWSSDDTAIAQVSADGRITPCQKGKVSITGMLTEVDGIALDNPISVKIPIYVVDVDTNGSSTTVSSYMETMTKEENLTAGTPGGPYLIVVPHKDYCLTGNEDETSSYCTGLAANPWIDFRHVWYYDGQNLRYGSPDGEYLTYENDKLALSTDPSMAFEVVGYPNSSRYIIQNQDIVNLDANGNNHNCVNLLGGPPYQAVGLWMYVYSSGWYFYQVTSDQPVTFSVAPSSSEVDAGNTVDLAPTVTLDNTQQSTYTIEWASSDTSVATVADGVVTALKSGSATITATLMDVNGQAPGMDLCVNIPITVPNPKPTITPKYPALSFEDEIVLDIFYTASDLGDVGLDDMGLLTWSAPRTDGTIENAEVVSAGARYDSTTGMYRVRTAGIPAKKLSDTIYFMIYIKLTDGTYLYSSLLNYSPKTYANSVLDGNYSTDMKALVVSMLNYGAEAQTYFNYKPYKLMNADLTAEQRALVKSYSPDMVAPVLKADSAKSTNFVNNGGFTKRYPTISFESAFSINYFFTPAYAVDDDVTLYYWSAADYSSVSTLTTANATGSVVASAGSEYEAAVKGIAAKDLDGTVYVAAVYKSGSTTYCSGVLAYSIGAYCLDRIDNGSVTMQAFAAATAVYGYYAKAYFIK